MSNEEKFNYVYKKYSKYILNVCYKYTKNRDDAEDYMHDAFIKINKVIESIDIDKCKTFITTIAINNTIDNLRKLKNKNNTYSIDDQWCDMNNPFSDDLKSGDGVQYDDLKLFIQNNADLLGERSSKIFSLFVFENYKHKEIADELHMNINTVRVDYMKARRIIRDLLQVEINR